MGAGRRFTRLELDADLQEQPLRQAAGDSLVVGAASQRLEERDAHHWMMAADADRRCGLHDGALRMYSRALEADRSLVAGWVGQVQMLVLLGEYPEADLWGRKALELFRNHPGLLAGRSQARCRLGDLKQAQALCDASLAQQGQTAYCWVARGELMLARRDPIEQYCFDKATQADGDWLVNLDAAGIYLHYKLPAKALGQCRAAVEKAPGHAHCWYVQGLAERALSLDRPAANSLRRCLELKPNHADARRALDELRDGGGFFARLLRRVRGRDDGGTL
jgi:tetratricopeptide (TPR) repeat protein